MKSINGKGYFYAIILDKTTGRYYGSKIKELILIDDFDDCMVQTENDERVIVPLRNLYNTCYDMLVALSMANQD